MLGLVEPTRSIQVITQIRLMSRVLTMHHPALAPILSFRGIRCFRVTDLGESRDNYSVSISMLYPPPYP